ncbi:MAG: hypothetical protein GX815_07305 [Clostridiales bacterium]|nr:hypothetical protein [Clostridiales bacterium]
MQEWVLMNRGKPVARFSTLNDNFIDKFTIINMDLLPEMLKTGLSAAMGEWLSSRKIDTTRSNARILLKRLGLSTSGLYPILFNRALSLTDTYWLKANPNDNFSKVCLHRKSHVTPILETSLSGALHDLPRITNTEITNIGSFNKAWIRLRDGWWLIKSDGPGMSKMNSYAELYAHKLGVHLGMDMAKYKAIKINGQVMTASKNFTNEVRTLEHYSSFKYRFSNREARFIESNFRALDLHKEYLNILLLDGLVSNPDRHEFNFGVIKSSSPGKVLALAPNFDNNLALGTHIPNGKPSTYLLREYLNTYGIHEWQKPMIAKLNMDIISSIDLSVKNELEEPNLNTRHILEYYNSILDGGLLSRYLKS